MIIYKRNVHRGNQIEIKKVIFPPRHYRRMDGKTDCNQMDGDLQLKSSFATQTLDHG